MNTTQVGTDFENRVFKLFSSLLKDDELPFAPQKYSKIFQHKKYPCVGAKREIDFDITIETYNPNSGQEDWSSLVVIECKCYSQTVDIADLDEFETKMRKVSDSGIKGIMVTTKGFSSTGIEQARTSHIALMVVSEQQYEWLVSRDITRSEQLMQVLLGRSPVGLTPIVYTNSQFVSLYDYLNQIGVVATDHSVVSIPWLSRDDIQKQANELYQECRVCSDDIAGMILAQKYPDYRITFADFSTGILGSLSFASKIITLSNEIINDIHRRNFTLAHELGHICLHQKNLEGFNNTFLDYEEEMAVNLPDKIISRMESQANQFASYLLMPQIPFKNEVFQQFKKHSITKGYLYLDHQSCNKHDVFMILSYLSDRFNVSKEAVKIRLINEKLLFVENKGLRRIDQILR